MNACVGEYLLYSGLLMPENYPVCPLMSYLGSPAIAMLESGTVRCITVGGRIEITILWISSSQTVPGVEQKENIAQRVWSGW